MWACLPGRTGNDEGRMTTDKADHREAPTTRFRLVNRQRRRAISGLGVIADRLESDPEECWPALEGLASLKLESRLAVLDALSKHDRSPSAEPCSVSCQRDATW